METPLTWRKSSFSGPGETNDCVELASVDGKIRLRESDAPADIVSTTPARLNAFIRAAKAGTLDHLTRPSTLWRKSSFSGNGEDNHCVELARAHGEIRLRESDTPADIISTTPVRLGTFIRAAKAGTLDHLTQPR